MQLFKPKSGKKEPRQIITDPFEGLLDIKSDIIKTFKQDVVKNTVTDSWKSILKPGEDNTSGAHQPQGEMKAGEEVNFESLKKREHAAPGDNYHREIANVGKKDSSRDSGEIEVKLQEIIIELRQLINSSQELKDKVNVEVIEQMGENPGVYHLNFLEQVLKWVRDARMNVEDSLAWFSALRSKKASKQYGALAKKGGTSFTLSNERTVATQSG